MLIRVEADDTLVAEAMKLGGHKTKREAASAALTEYIRYKRRIGIVDMFGKVDFRPEWDYKAARRRSNKRIPKSQVSIEDIERFRKNIPPKGRR
jgi:hypothetical protein